jgi:predicted dehydrogenase
MHTDRRKPIRVGLVGAGAIARAHALAYVTAQPYCGPQVPPVKLGLVADSNEQLAKAAVERLGFEAWTRDWQEVVANPDIDLVSIATPNFLHAPVAIAAAEAGKHVFCEKPIATSSAEAKQMWWSAERAGIVHGVNLNYRKVPAIRFVARLIAEGRIGEIRQFRSAYLQDWANDPRIPRSWKFDAALSGGGAVSGVGTHIIDLAHALVGEIERVVATTGIWIKERPLTSSSLTFEVVEARTELAPVTNDDSACFLARFTNGAIGTFEIGRCAAGRKNHLSFEIYGSCGSITYDYEQPNEVKLYTINDGAETEGYRTILIGPAQDKAALLAYPGVPVGFAETIIFQIGDLLSAIAGGPPMVPSFYDGWRAQTVVDAVLASAGQSWVAVAPCGRRSGAGE